MHKPKNIIAVHFWDHSAFTKDLTQHIVVGELVDENKDRLTIRWWIPLELDCDESDKNSEYVAISKKDIIKRWKATWRGTHIKKRKSK